MIDIPLARVLEKLKEHGLSDEEIETKIKQKMDQLSGLISREGAAHIIANEQGVKLVETTSGKVKLKDVLAGMRSVETVGKVTNVFEVREFQRKDGNGSSKVGSFIIGDDTGTLRVTAWGDQADNITALKQDDVVKIVSGYARTNQGRVEIHLNDSAKLIVNPPGETIGDISFSARTFEKKKINALNETLVNVEVLGTIVGVDALRFFQIDPQTKRRVQPQRDNWVLDGKIIANPEFSYVMNIILDDGTGNIRVACFREMVEKVLSLDRTSLLALKDSPELEQVKQKALGTIVKVKGKPKRNQMFDRLEFMCQDIDMKPDPYEEIESVDKELTEAQQTQEVPSIDEI